MATFTPFNPGVGSTIKSTSVEAALLEAALLLQEAESAYAAGAPNPAITSPSTVAVNFFTGDNTTQIQFAVPITDTTDPTDGSVKVAVKSSVMVPVAGFGPGVGGDLKSTDIGGAILELAQKLSGQEALQATAPVNGIQSIALDLENNALTMTAQLPIVIAITPTGSVAIDAAAYLI
jgi:hypothetical protein